MIKNKTTKDILWEIIEFGLEIEMIDYNYGKGYGYDGYDQRSKIPGIREKARRRIYELSNRGIDAYDYDYVYTDENGIEWDLEYSTQFI